MTQGKDRRDKKRERVEEYERLVDTTQYRNLRTQVIELLQRGKIENREAQIFLSHLHGKSLTSFALKEGELNGILEELRELLQKENQ